MADATEDTGLSKVEDRIAAARSILGSETCAWLDEALRCFIIEPGDGALEDRAEFLEIIVGIVDNAKSEQKGEIERLTALERLRIKDELRLNNIIEDNEDEIARLRATIERAARLASHKWPTDRMTYPTGTDERATFADVAVRLCEDELRAALEAAHNG